MARPIEAQFCFTERAICNGFVIPDCILDVVESTLLQRLSILCRIEWQSRNHLLEINRTPCRHSATVGLRYSRPEGRSPTLAGSRSQTRVEAGQCVQVRCRHNVI